MAWLDDRVWCHPKLTDLSNHAFRVWAHGICYSTGFGTRGRLTRGQQRTIGADKKATAELVDAGLWDIDGSEVVYHEWDEKNGRRDDRRAKDRERKRVERERKRAEESAGLSTGRSKGSAAGPARAEGSEGSEGSDKSKAFGLDVLQDHILRAVQ